MLTTAGEAVSTMGARLVTGLLHHAIIEAFVSGEGEGSEELERGVRELLATGLIRQK